MAEKYIYPPQNESIRLGMGPPPNGTSTYAHEPPYLVSMKPGPRAPTLTREQRDEFRRWSRARLLKKLSEADALRTTLLAPRYPAGRAEVRDSDKVIPAAVLRAMRKEPLLSRDPVQRSAQIDRIRKLVEGQPLNIKRLARAMLKARWNRLAPPRR